MARRPMKNHVDWFENNRQSYTALAHIVSATIKTLLQNESIDVVDVTHRAKTVKSFAEKIKRKNYLDPKREMTDLAGVRVITLIERDIESVTQIIKNSFNINAGSSVDKSVDLGSDRFGYRSVHFVCDIGEKRAELPEFSPYAGMLFEIQVRTALQHAWAEIEHDRSYKFSGELPSKLKRRFHLIAGLLELADREFSSLTEELESYTKEVSEKTGSGNFQIELNSTSAHEYLNVIFNENSELSGIKNTKLSQDIIAELRRFGVETVSDFAVLVNEKFIKDTGGKEKTVLGLVRDAMLYEDIDRYFEVAWQEAWHGWDEDGINLVEKKYGHEKISEIVRKYSLDVIPDI